MPFKRNRRIPDPVKVRYPSVKYYGLSILLLFDGDRVGRNSAAYKGVFRKHFCVVSA